MSNSQEDKLTDDWYKSYYAKRGVLRNDVIGNPGVLFQFLSTRRSIIESLHCVDLPKIGAKILDVGCGSGGSLSQFIDYGFDPQGLYGLDILEERIDEGKKKYPTMNLIRGDATSMNYDDGAFDLVMESTMFMQLTNEVLAQNIASEMLRVTKDGGYLMLIDWRYSFGKKEYCALSKKRIQALFKIGILTEYYSRKPGALIPPVGRFLSQYIPSIYFILAKILPVLVAQEVTVLRKIS